MKFNNYAFLFLFGLGTVLVVSLFQDAPGYMDADYYYAGGLQLAQGRGFSEPFLWNYLDMPDGVPHPSHTYWMPLPSILAMLGIALTGIPSFSSGRLGFLFVAGFIPVVTGALAYSLSGKKPHALLAGMLAAIPGFYTSYLGTTDSFGIYMLLGGLFFLCIGFRKRLGANLQPFLLGLVAGLMHLTRADGIIWLFLGLLSVTIITYRSTRADYRQSSASFIRKYLLPVILCLLGYTIVFAPWMVRNYNTFGALLASSGIKSLWLTDYNQLYSFPPSSLTPGNWLASGLNAILRARFYALWQNLQTAFVVQGVIFLAPLILLGLWHYRRDIRVQIGGLGWLITLLVMSFAFPFVGWRGGFFHSGAAFQCLFWSAAPVGLELFIGWGVKHRRWIPKQATTVFSTGVIIISLLLAGIVIRNRVVGRDMFHPAWNESNRIYQEIEEGLRQEGAGKDDIVLVNNAPGYFVATGRPAISIPDGNLNTALQVAKKFGGAYLIVEYNHPAGLEQIYEAPKDYPGIEYLTTIDGAHLFRMTE
jgi:hypothetical protein